jgi:hypothetical protein
MCSSVKAESPAFEKIGGMMKYILSCFALFFLVAFAAHMGAQTSPSIVILDEPNFPVIDTAPLPTALLHQALPTAIFSPASELNRHLSVSARRLCWSYLMVRPSLSISGRQSTSFSRMAATCLTLGGRPFTRPARFENGQWRLLPETYAFAREAPDQRLPGNAWLFAPGFPSQ